MFSWFKKKDPVCGMVKKDGEGVELHDQWFCSKACVKEWEDARKQDLKQQPQAAERHGGCC